VIAKILLVAIVVAAVVLTGLGILAIAGALAPYAGAGAGWAMLGLGAAGFGLAFGPRWLKIAISVALAVIGIYLQGPQAILNLTAGGHHGGTLGGAAASVGAVAGFVLSLQQGRKRGKGRDKRKKDPIVAIIVDPATMQELAQLTQKQLDKYNEEAKAHNACVNRESDIFNENVGKITKAAHESYEKNHLPWWIEWATNIGGGSKPEDRLLEQIPEIFNYNQMMDEIERRTKQATAQRDQAIQNNCKQPAIP